jgi:beta-phosphoglucomutase
MIRAIIWDLDGTLADTEELHFHAWRQVLAAYQIDHTYADFLRGFGRRNVEIIPELLGAATTTALIETIGRDKESIYLDLLRQSDLRLMPGVAAWLDHFRGAGLPQVIGSSGSMGNIAATVEHLRIGDYFHGLVTSAGLAEGKPNPTIFLRAAAAVEANPAHCLVIEDSVPGIEAARRAGMHSVAVGKVIHTPALHERLAAIPGRPTIQVETLEELRWEQVMRNP